MNNLIALRFIDSDGPLDLSMQKCEDVITISDDDDYERPLDLSMKSN